MKYIFIYLIIIVQGTAAMKKDPAEDKNNEKEQLGSPVSIDLSMTIVSRYIWRGLNINNAPNLQPGITLGYAGFSLGLWGSYAFTNDSYDASTASLNSEIDLYVSYTLPTPAGTFTAVVTDYYFPQAGSKLGNFNDHDHPDGGGGHLFEGGLIYTLPGSVPVSFSGYYNFFNDAGNNTYFEISYPFSINDLELSTFAGATTGSIENPAYYSTENAAVINAGFTISKEIKITEDFSLPVYSSFIINPRLEIPYLVFGITL